MFNSKENGFSLVELIVVLIITAILAQLGYSAFNRYVRRTRAFAAKTALKNIQRECESNRDLEAPETFTLLPIRGYSIATRDTNSCLGQSSDGKVAAIADNQDEIPNYFYDFLLGQISCSFNNPSSGLFKDCLTNNDSLAVNYPLRDSNGNLIINDVKVWNMGNCQAVYGEVMKEDPDKKANEYPNNFQTRYVMLSPDHPSAKKHYERQAKNIRSSNSQPCKTVKAPLEAFGGVKPKAWEIPKRYGYDENGNFKDFDPNHQNSSCSNNWCGAYNYYRPEAAFDSEGNPIVVIRPDFDSPEKFKSWFGFEADFSTLNSGLKN